ncbi:MAG: large subunit ribosomal protein [Thermoproteota archaeon]|nr:large subunit ribosomal protein [Thermoproteota archaeon]
MPHSLRKVRKRRGSRTYGWGQVTQHRGAGSHGGHGNTGGHKHKWTYTVKYDPDRYGKHGFTHPLNVEVIAVNVEYLEVIVRKMELQKDANEDKIVTIDLEQLGVHKLLGLGKITIPVRVKVGSYSESALRKIEAVGGQILTDE